MKAVSIWGIVDIPDLGSKEYSFTMNGPYCGLFDENLKVKDSFVNIYELMKNTSAEQTEGEQANRVSDIQIDLSSVGDTTFTKSGSFIDFRSQLDSRFDLKYYDSVEVEYTYEATDTSDWSIGKIAVADETSLTGYADGLAYTLGMTATNNKVTIDVNAIDGKCAGINIQPMNSSWEWPNGLTSVTITGITLKAKDGATYDA